MLLVEFCENDRIFDCKNGYHEFDSVLVDSDSVSECIDWLCDELEFANENSENYYFMFYQYNNGARILVIEGDKEDIVKSQPGEF